MVKLVACLWLKLNFVQSNFVHYIIAKWENSSILLALEHLRQSQAKWDFRKFICRFFVDDTRLTSPPPTVLVQLWNFAGNLFSRRCKIRAQSRNSPISIGFSSIFFFSQALPLIRKWFPLWSKEANRGSWIINDDVPEEIFISSQRSRINFNTNRFHLELSEARFLLQHAQIELKLIKINFSRLNQLFYSIGSHFADPAAPQSPPNADNEIIF